MGLVNWFTNKNNDSDRILVRDLITIAISDREFTKDERETLLVICREKGISDVQLMNALRGETKNVGAKMPITIEGKRDYLSQLINLIYVDSDFSPLEIHALEIIAKGIGMDRMHIISVILDEIEKEKIPSKRGYKILKTIVDYFIENGQTK